ncbi:hypothetical protein LQZ19_08680 [Treponema primitia]|uniref:hypothetical protein n=1 Tax=Treponema primitia TaxID=88058 RepID=UPI00397EFCB4
MALIGTFTPVDLFNGLFPVVEDVRMIPNGTPAFSKGAILTAANIPVVSAGTPDVIALEDIDASAASSPVRCPVALSGGFNSNALSTGDATDPITFKDVLRTKSIYIRPAMQKGGDE